MRCAYCGVHMLKRGKRSRTGRVRRESETTDHIIPKSRFASGAYDFPSVRNLVLVCQHCNGLKGDMWPLDWLRVMPEYGVARFAERLAAMGCGRSGIDRALEDRKRASVAVSEGATSGT